MRVDAVVVSRHEEPEPEEPKADPAEAAALTACQALVGKYPEEKGNAGMRFRAARDKTGDWAVVAKWAAERLAHLDEQDEATKRLAAEAPARRLKKLPPAQRPGGLSRTGCLFNRHRRTRSH